MTPKPTQVFRIGKHFITYYFKSINSKSSDQEPKETRKEIYDLERRLKKLEDENFKIKI